MGEVENTISNRPSPQEMERRLNVLAYAKTLPQAKNIVKLEQGKSYDFDELKEYQKSLKTKNINQKIIKLWNLKERKGNGIGNIQEVIV